MIKALIFDFDGVIADSEPVHLEAFQKTVESLGLRLSASDYYSKYLACDDKTFFRDFLKNNNVRAKNSEIQRLEKKKGEHFEEMIRKNVRIFPGVTEFLKAAEGRFHSAIGSGALIAEISFILKLKGLSEFFDFAIGADDTQNPKPSPEVYLKCLKRLRECYDDSIVSDQCVVFEDSPHGVLAAKRAGMKCVGITNSCNAEQLSLADRVVGSFFEILEDLSELP